jgi:hexosaminidase
VRNHARNRMGMALLKGKKPTPEEFNALADAASPDSLVARRFALEAERFVRGDRSGAAALKATLASRRNNHDRFAAVARGNLPFEAALPISGDIAALGSGEALKGSVFPPFGRTICIEGLWVLHEIWPKPKRQAP